MLDKDAKSLLKKYRTGECTPDEKAFVENYIFFEEDADDDLGENELESEVEILRAKIAQIPLVRKLLVKHVASYAVAAAIFFGLCIGIYLMIAGRNDNTFEYDADPGTSKATITLTDGTKINVTDAKQGELSAKSDLQITKTGNGQVAFKFRGTPSYSASAKNLLNTIETPKGGEYVVYLPDGSKVWLNAASTLQFPSTFASGGKREVQLSGEAYFEIKKDKAHPFVVSSATQQVEVLGTHFDVSSYADDATVKTTLLEGSVRVSLLSTILPRGLAKSKDIILKPNQQATNNSGLVTVKEVQAEKEIAWQKGRFTFNDEPLGNIMLKLARWYDLKVIYKDKDIQYKTVAGSASRYAKVSDILCQLELTGQVHFKIKGKEITVMK